jgi:FkbM family methyltransferase
MFENWPRWRYAACAAVALTLLLLVLMDTSPPSVAPTLALPSSSPSSSSSSLGPYKCQPHGSHPIRLAAIELTGAWLSPRHRPLQYTMIVHGPDEDSWISTSWLQKKGNEAFEETKRIFLYRTLYLGEEKARQNLIVDIGANIGSHALFLAQLQQEVHALEAHTRNMELLRCSAVLNAPMTNHLFLYHMALGNVSGSVCMQVDPQTDNQGSPHVGPAQAECVGGEIPMQTLDWFWENKLQKRQIDVMKIDVEGYEPRVFDGAVRMMEQAPPRIVLSEMAPFFVKTWYQSSVKKWLGNFLKRGYTISFFTDCGSSPAGTAIDESQPFWDALDDWPFGHMCDIEMRLRKPS